jgi:5'-nucleotidase
MFHGSDATIILNEQKLEQAIAAMKRGGAGRIHVLADFDKTLTKAFVRGKAVPSSVSVLRDNNKLTEGYAEKARAHFKHYHAIEIDPSVPMAEKKKAMHEWWTAHFDLIIASGLAKDDIRYVVESGWMQFRDGASDLFALLAKNNIPLVIMSATGLGNEVIELFFKQQRLLTNNIHIIANAFIWNEKGIAISYKEPIIHVFNKDETLLQNFPAFEDIKHRTNVIMLGDSVGDIGMVEGFPYENLITAGFLNSEEEKYKENFQKNFDMVIVGDGPLTPVTQLLKNII